MEDSDAYSGRGLTGIADAITWDNDGNVTIWDFKTTANGEVSLDTKLYRYL
jgi:RecB family exonuclease